MVLPPLISHNAAICPFSFLLSYTSTMSDLNTFTAAAGDSKAEAKKPDGVDGPSSDDFTNGDEPSVMDSFCETLDDDDNRNNTSISTTHHTPMRTIDEENPSEFDSSHEQERMAVLDNYLGSAEKHTDNNDNVGVNDDFGASYDPHDTDMMDSTYDNNNDYADDPSASQPASEYGDQQYGSGNYHTQLRIDTSSSPQDAANAWYGAAKDEAATPSPHTGLNVTNATGERHREDEAFAFEHQEHAEEAEPQDEIQEPTPSPDESATNEIVQELSSKLDERLQNTRLLAKTLLQEMTIYAASLEAVANEYGRIREAELLESQRLDVMEPEVTGASGMLLASAASGHGGFPADDNESMPPPQQHPPPPSMAGIHRRHSSPLKERPMRPHRDRPLTPIVGNRRRGTGKENYGSLRRSFA